MKHYYFMNKSEIIELQDLENPEGYIKYYYSRKERIKSKNNNLDLCKKVTNRKRRRFIYLFNAITLILMFFLYRNYSKNYYKSSIIDKEWKYSLKIAFDKKKYTELLVYLENISDQRKKINTDLKVQFFTSINKSILMKKNIKLLNINNFFKKKEKRLFLSIPFVIKNLEVNYVGVIIKDNLFLYKKINIFSN